MQQAKPGDLISKDLKPGHHIHLMGICGTAMGSLAGLLKAAGYKVTGSDTQSYPPMSDQLAKLGIPIMQGFKKENLCPEPDLVIVGNVISKHYEEAEALLASDIPYTSLPKALAEFVIQDRHSIVIAGTHGKTTTTAMMSWVAECCGQQPGYLIGGVPLNFDNSFKLPERNLFIIEGDEYDTAFFDKVPKFIHYKPRSVILTSIEFDHADIYKDLDDVKQSFKRLVEIIPTDGLLIANGDDANVREIAALAKCRVVYYGLNTGNDYQAVDREILFGRNQFCVLHHNRREADIASKQFGPHNTLNLLATYALAKEIQPKELQSKESQWPTQQTLQGLSTFKGVKRRQEELGTPNGITVIEDFAHHPTAVRLTLQTLKERFPQQRVIAIFEARSATSRRRVFQDAYAEALSYADVIFLPQPYDQSKIAEEERFSSDELITTLNTSRSEAYLCTSVDEIVEKVTQLAKPKDVVIIMSNGGFEGIYGKIMQALS